MIAARSAGAGWIGVTGLAHDGDRLDLARSLGADMTATVEHGDIASSVANSLGARPDVVIDVTSSDPEAIYMGLDLVRAGGRVVPCLDQRANTVTQLFSDIVVLKELTLKGVFGATSAGYHWATRQLEVDARLDQLVSHEFLLDELIERQAAGGLLGREELISVAVTF